MQITENGVNHYEARGETRFEPRGLFREKLGEFDIRIKRALGQDGTVEALARLFPEPMFHEQPEQVDSDFDVAERHMDIRLMIESEFNYEPGVSKNVSELGTVDWAVETVQQLVAVRGEQDLRRIVKVVGDVGVIVRGSIPDENGTLYQSRPNTNGFRRLYQRAIKEVYPTLETVVYEENVSGSSQVSTAI